MIDKNAWLQFLVIPDMMLVTINSSVTTKDHVFLSLPLFLWPVSSWFLMVEIQHDDLSKRREHQSAQCTMNGSLEINNMSYVQQHLCWCCHHILVHTSIFTEPLISLQSCQYQSSSGPNTCWHTIHAGILFAMFLVTSSCMKVQDWPWANDSRATKID